MHFLQWLGIDPAGIQIQDPYTESQSQTIAGEQITIDWHEVEKQRTQQWITERKAIAAQMREGLSSDGARYWFDLSESDQINWLEQSIQWNDRYIAHARTDILYHRQRARA